MEEYFYTVYIATNQRNTVLYTGITNNIERRMWEHKNKVFKGFTSKYNIDKLVYFDQAKDVNVVIAREKQIKGWTRAKKIDVIEKQNPEWLDLMSSHIKTLSS